MYSQAQVNFRVRNHLFLTHSKRATFRANQRMGRQSWIHLGASAIFLWIATIGSSTQRSWCSFVIGEQVFGACSASYMWLSPSSGASIVAFLVFVSTGGALASSSADIRTRQSQSFPKSSSKYVQLPPWRPWVGASALALRQPQEFSCCSNVGQSGTKFVSLRPSGTEHCGWFARPITTALLSSPLAPSPLSAGRLCGPGNWFSSQ